LLAIWQEEGKIKEWNSIKKGATIQQNNRMGNAYGHIADSKDDAGAVEKLQGCRSGG
jgi:hypothetical protein